MKKGKSLTIKQLAQLVSTILSTAFKNVYKTGEAQVGILLLVFLFLHKTPQKQTQVVHSQIFLIPYVFFMNDINNR